MIIVNPVIASRSSSELFIEDTFIPLMQYRENDLLYAIFSGHNIPKSLIGMHLSEGFHFGSAMITEMKKSKIISIGVCPYKTPEDVKELISDLALFTEGQVCYVPEDLISVPGAEIVFDELRNNSLYEFISLKDLFDKNSKG